MKKKASQAEARRIVTRVPADSAFWLCTNNYLRSLREIAETLENVEDEVFRYHVSRDKNDFECWIRRVVKDKELAREIARIKTRQTLVRKINERLEELRKVLNARKKEARRKKKQGKSVRKQKIRRR